MSSRHCSEAWVSEAPLQSRGTYLDEDFMRRIKHVAQQASGGGLVHTTSILVQKWRRGTWLSWAVLKT